MLPALLTLNWALALGVAAIDCGGFGHLENGRTFFRYGGRYVAFSCNPGFRMHGQRTSSCVSGQWVRPPPVCVAPGCRSPGKILHGNTSVSPDGSLVQFACDAGFRLSGSPLLYCKGKTWNGSTPVCTELDIMDLFQQKQASLHKPALESDQDMTSLKSHFRSVSVPAVKESLLKSSQQTYSLVSEDSHPKAPKRLRHEPIPTPPRLGLQPFKQPAAPFPATLTSKPTTTSHSSSTNDQQRVPSTFLDQNGEDERETYLTSSASLRHGIPVAPSQASAWITAEGIETTADSAKERTKADYLQPLQVTEQASVLVPPTENEPQATSTASSLPFGTSGSYDVERITSAAGLGETFPTHVPVVRPNPVVTTRDLHLKPDEDLPHPRTVHTVYDIYSGINGRENATVTRTLVSTATHDGSSYGNRRRPVCHYPPLPAHGTFYFRTIPNPAPFQFRYYIQYACYAGYTLANGDVDSYCLQDGQWSGVTPKCIGLTPCSLNNGGCSQGCQVNAQNQAECRCEPGFQLLADRRTCRDLDECVEGLHECQQVCENTFGSYRCSCSAGFRLQLDRMSCTDVNECMLPSGQARCRFGCVNTPGSFHCRCPVGYSTNATDGQCEDIDECMENRGICARACVNTPGSFRCACPNGYQLAGDGTTCIPECPTGYRGRGPSAPQLGNPVALDCVDINECEEMRHHQQHTCEWRCVNLPGTHRCVCPRGYTRHPNGYQCNDINECTLRNGGCSHVCKNHRGGYKCACPANSRISPYGRKTCHPV